MRDFLAATRERVVVYDGGMGATLEQFDLSLEDDYRLPGRCHEALVLNRPDVIEGVHASMLEAGAEVLETDTFQGSRLKLAEWGLEDHTLEINHEGGARSRARRRASTASSPARSARPASCPPATTRRSGRSASASCVEVFTEQARGLLAGRRRPDHHRDRAGHPRGQGRGVRRPRGVQGAPAARVPIQCSVSLLPQGGKMLLGTDISAVLATLEALDVDVIGLNCSTGPGGHARRDPLPGRVQLRCRSTASPTPACRSRARTARRSSPSSPSRWPPCSASSSSATASRSSAAAAARRRTHIAAIAERVAGRTPGARARAPRRRTCSAR